MRDILHIITYFMEKETYCFDYYIVYSVMPGSIITNLAVDYILFCG